MSQHKEIADIIFYILMAVGIILMIKNAGKEFEEKEPPKFEVFVINVLKKLFKRK